MLQKRKAKTQVPPATWQPPHMRSIIASCRVSALPETSITPPSPLYSHTYNTHVLQAATKAELDRVRMQAESSAEQLQRLSRVTAASSEELKVGGLTQLIHTQNCPTTTTAATTSSSYALSASMSTVVQ